MNDLNEVRQELQYRVVEGIRSRLGTIIILLICIALADITVSAARIYRILYLGG